MTRLDMALRGLAFAMAGLALWMASCAVAGREHAPARFEQALAPAAANGLPRPQALAGSAR